MTDLRARTEEMVDMLGLLVGVESPTSDVPATRRCADVLASVGADLLGSAPERIERDGRVHLLFGSSPSDVLLVGHLDTVWPLGTTERWPFEVRDAVATGPGCFDMKAGVVQGLFALSALGRPSDASFLVTTDEEFGAPTSRMLIEDLARTSRAALVLEPAVGDAVKVARKGVSVYEIEAHGRAAHSGLDPQAGRSALIEIAHQILALEKIARPETTVTPTLATAGSAANTVPASAKVTVDVRSPTPDEQERVHAELTRLRPVTEEVEVTVHHKLSSPPFPRSASTELFEKAQRVASSLGIPTLRGAEVGGGSDGNYTAGVGTPTLDGLGPVGDGAHAEGEHVVIEHMPARAALVAALVTDLLEGEQR